MAQAAGLNIFGVIAQWTDETFRFIPTDSDPAANSDTGQEDAERLHSALQAIGMDGLFPTWCLDGFTPGDLKITELRNGEDRIYTVVVDHFMQPQSSTGTSYDVMKGSFSRTVPCFFCLLPISRMHSSIIFCPRAALS